MCIAITRSLGGRLEAALPSAAALEIYHNAFLIHDDVEDGSDFRRQSPTLHRAYGVPIAVNVGDAMLALTLDPLLGNMRTLGLGKALRILQLVSRMARESAEGQAIELDWIRHAHWSLRDADYVRMVYKKTSWYSFVTPLVTGAIIAGASPALIAALRRFGALLGIAFQLQDDILNLTAERELYGKEIGGDLWEGKHTLILLHMMRSVSEAEQTRARAILAKARPEAEPDGTPADDDGGASALVAALERSGRLSAAESERLRAGLSAHRSVRPDHLKTEADVAELLALIDGAGSMEYARAAAFRWASRAQRVFGTLRDALEPSVHRDFLEQLVRFVVGRDH
jgi:geranylgeranyl diphosphate synthase type II